MVDSLVICQLLSTGGKKEGEVRKLYLTVRLRATYGLLKEASHRRT